MYRQVETSRGCDGRNGQRHTFWGRLHGRKDCDRPVISQTSLVSDVPELTVNPSSPLSHASQLSPTLPRLANISFTLIQLTGTVNTSVFSRHPRPEGQPGRQKRRLIRRLPWICRRFLCRCLLRRLTGKYRGHFPSRVSKKLTQLTLLKHSAEGKKRPLAQKYTNQTGRAAVCSSYCAF